LGELIKAAASNNAVLLNREFERSRFLAAFIEDVINPPIPHFERQKIGGHAHGRLRQ
jgi:hypothetical protein